VLPLRDRAWSSVLSSSGDRSTELPSRIVRVVPARDRVWSSVSVSIEDMSIVLPSAMVISPVPAL